jgi:hypothetical protein
LDRSRLQCYRRPLGFYSPKPSFISPSGQICSYFDSKPLARTRKSDGVLLLQGLDIRMVLRAGFEFVSPSRMGLGFPRQRLEGPLSCRTQRDDRARRPEHLDPSLFLYQDDIPSIAKVRSDLLWRRGQDIRLERIHIYNLLITFEPVAHMETMRVTDGLTARCSTWLSYPGAPIWKCSTRILQSM